MFIHRMLWELVSSLTLFDVAADAVIEIRGDVYVARSRYGSDLYSSKSLAKVFRRVFSYLGSRGGTIRLGPGDFELDEMVVPAPFPNDMMGTIRIVGSGIDVTRVFPKNDSAIPTYGAMFGYGYSGINPRIERVEFYNMTLDGAYGENTTGPRNASIVDCGRYRVFINVKFTRSPGFTVFNGDGVRYWFINCVFENTGQPDADTHYDIIGGGRAGGWIIGCLYKDSAGNYVDHVNPRRVVFAFNMSENHLIGGMYAVGYRSIVVFNQLENVNEGSGICKDASTTEVETPNVVLFNVLKNINVCSPPAAVGDIYMDQYGALFLPPPPRDLKGMLVIENVGKLARGGGGSQLSIDGGAYGIEIYDANTTKLIALLRKDYIQFFSKVTKIGLPFYSDCSNIPSSGSYEGEVVACYDSTAAKYVLKVWDGSAWQTIG